MVDLEIEFLNYMTALKQFSDSSIRLRSRDSLKRQLAYVALRAGSPEAARPKLILASCLRRKLPAKITIFWEK